MGGKVGEKRTFVRVEPAGGLNLVPTVDQLMHSLIYVIIQSLDMASTPAPTIRVAFASFAGD